MRVLRAKIRHALVQGFAVGAASTFDVYGRFAVIPRVRTVSGQQDWKMIGDDMRVALNTYGRASHS